MVPRVSSHRPVVIPGASVHWHYFSSWNLEAATVASLVPPPPGDSVHPSSDISLYGYLRHSDVLCRILYWSMHVLLVAS